MNTLRTTLALGLQAASVLILSAPGSIAAPAERFAVNLRPETALASAVQPFVDSNTLAGAVMLVASKDRVLGLDAVGWSDIAARKPMATDALFWIASQSKPMTAAAFMMLVDEGKVSLDDPVEKYLPEFKGQMLAVERDAEHVLLRKPAHPITVREVLSHTSGLPFSSPMEQPTLDGLPLRDAVRSYAMVPLQFPPGTKYPYSNAGINTEARTPRTCRSTAGGDWSSCGWCNTTAFRGTAARARTPSGRRRWQCSRRSRKAR